MTESSPWKSFSRTGLAITNEEYENQHGDDEIESRLKRADEASGSDSPQPTPTEGTATICWGAGGDWQNRPLRRAGL